MTERVSPVKPLDLTKPIITKRGWPVRILATDLKKSKRPLIVAVTDTYGYEEVHTYPLSGKWLEDGVSPSDKDLVNTPEITTAYLNIYPLDNWWEYQKNYDSTSLPNTPRPTKTLEESNSKAFSHRLAVLKLVYSDDILTTIEIIQNSDIGKLKGN